MKNNRTEIMIASVLLFSFFLFLVSYSNYDMGNIKVWNGGEIHQFVYPDRHIIDRNYNSFSSVRSTLQRLINYLSTEKNTMGILNHSDKDELRFHGIYSQLLFQRKKIEVPYGLTPISYT